jgi:hypothetical protein
MHCYLRVVCVGGQCGQSRVAGLGPYSTIIHKEDGGKRGKRAYEYREGFYHHNETTLRLTLCVPVRHDHVIEWSHITEDMI